MSVFDDAADAAAAQMSECRWQLDMPYTETVLSSASKVTGRGEGGEKLVRS